MKSLHAMVIFVPIWAASCTQGADFQATTQSPKPVQKRAVASESVTAATPTASPTPTPIPPLSREQKTQECWFAVSGTYVGRGDYSDTFPLPTGGGKITQAASFDTVGGVFLYARAEPYVYQQGGREIDGAVNDTFHGIVVPEGMSVDIRASADDVPMFSGSGPLIAIDGSGTSGYGSPFTYKDKFDAGQLRHWPLWMLDYLSNNEGKVKILPLQEARWVKVSANPGGRCAESL